MTHVNKMLYSNLTGYGHVVQLVGVSSVGGVANMFVKWSLALSCIVWCCSGSISSVPEIAMSLCGGLDHQDARISDDAFNRYLVTHEALCENPALLSDPSLVVRVGGKYV